VTTVRTPVPEEIFDRVNPDLVVLSPGPGSPTDFDCKATIKKSRARDLPIFGVCLGLQALAEAYGGELRHLAHAHARQAVAHPRAGARHHLLRSAARKSRSAAITRSSPIRCACLNRDFVSRPRARTA
jgi:anthranilate/para-aminobenzoate synthase component II